MTEAITFLLLTGLMSSSLIVPSVLTFFCLSILKSQFSFLSLVSAPFCCLEQNVAGITFTVAPESNRNLIDLAFNLKFT